MEVIQFGILECALNHVRFRAAMHPTWCMADCGIIRAKALSYVTQPFRAEG
jgi:hypothetical protein